MLAVAAFMADIEMNTWTAIRYAGRSLARTPALLLAVSFTIAFGVGSNAVVQSFVRGLPGGAAGDGEASDLTMLLRLAAGAIFVLACANLVALLLSRAGARSRDTALRVAIGARRAQLVQQLLSEGLVFACCGGALGMLSAIWTAQIVPALFWAPDAEQLRLDLSPQDLLLVSAACIVVVAACGLAPLVEVHDKTPASILQREGPDPSPSARRLRAVLVIAQTAGCCFFVVSANNVMSGFEAALETALGERAGDPVLATVGVKPVAGRAEFEVRTADYFAAAERTARQATGIDDTAWIVRPPGSTPNTQLFIVEASGLPRDEVALHVEVFRGSSLREMVVPPRAGRLFNARDTPGGCQVALLNERAADDLFDGRAIGRVVRDSHDRALEIVGIVALRDGAAAARPTIYYYGPQAAGIVRGPARFQVPSVDHRAPVVLDTNSVEPQYFERMGLPRLAGTIFSHTETGCRVGVIDRAAAERYIEGDPVGAAIIDPAGRRTTITGVVETARLRHWQRPPGPVVYFPVGQELVGRMTLMLFANESSSVNLTRLQEALAGIPNGFGGVAITTLRAYLSRTAFAPERLASMFMVIVATLAAALGAIGLHGVIAESVRQRRRELALRMTLGSGRRRVILQVIGSSLRLAGAGAIVGVLLAALVAPELTGAMTGSAPVSGWAWVSGIIALIAVAVVASLLPVYRAVRTNLTEVLRDS